MEIRGIRIKETNLGGDDGYSVDCSYKITLVLQDGVEKEIDSIVEPKIERKGSGRDYDRDILYEF